MKTNESHRFLMKTMKYQWMKDLHLMKFVFVWLGILYLLILVFSSQWLTEAAFVRTLCICVFWPCICILALLMLCSCFVKPYFFTNKSCISWWIIIDHSMQHWLHWVHNYKSIIIWKEVFKCRIKRTGYHHNQLLKLFWI